MHEWIDLHTYTCTNEFKTKNKLKKLINIIKKLNYIDRKSIHTCVQIPLESSSYNIFKRFKSFDIRP